MEQEEGAGVRAAHGNSAAAVCRPAACHHDHRSGCGPTSMHTPATMLEGLFQTQDCCQAGSIGDSQGTNCRPKGQKVG